MKIWCTVLRKNGSYKSIAVKAGKDSFELDDNIYFVRGYRIGQVGPLHILRAFYIEGLPEPFLFDVDKAAKTAKLKIDTRAIRNLTEKKMLSVFTDAELTRIEQILIVIVGSAAALSFACLIMTMQVLDKLSTIM